MQVGKFSTGAYYAHKVRLPDSPMKFYVWYNVDGTLSDAEAIDRLNRSRPVTAKQRDRLAAMSDLISVCIEAESRGWTRAD
jgi:hypothetical protein